MAAGDPAAQRPPPLFLPLLASIVACALLSGLWLMSMGGFREGFLLGFLFGGAISMPHALLLGIPYAYWLRWNGWFDGWRMALGGFLIGGVPLGMLGPLLGLWTGAIGALSALAFLATYRGLQRRG